MENSKQFLKSHDIRPKISFKDGKAHTVTLLNDKIESITDDSGKDIEGVKYLVRENDEKKTIFTSSIGLISKLSEFEVDTTVTIQMKRKKGEGGGFKSFYEVSEYNPVPGSDTYEGE